MQVCSGFRFAQFSFFTSPVFAGSTVNLNIQLILHIAIFLVHLILTPVCCIIVNRRYSRVKYVSIVVCVFLGVNLLCAEVVQPVPPNYVPQGLFWVHPTDIFSGPFGYRPGVGWQPGTGTLDAGQEWNDRGSQNPDYGILGHLPFTWYGGYNDSGPNPPSIQDDPCGGHAFAVTSNFGTNQSQSTSHFLLGKPDCRDDVRVWPSTDIPNKPDKPDEPEIPEQPIPEPSTVVLLGGGIGLIVLSRRNK
jgi:hypothetical protein